ncbi:MAG: hypothetical protein R3253_14075 [Longimicrobiales bacterium]|nr:hypothetical protein [Longimicrobiales bacterium]
MTEEEPLPRLYGDEEIGRILKRATELQHREPQAPPAGVTLSELEEIAAEAGIDPSYLRRAALEVEAGHADPTIWSRLLGAELGLFRETTLRGEVGDDGFERIVTAIQAASKEHGQPSLLGRTLTWRAETASKTRTVQVVVTSRDGKTHIRVEENLNQMASGLFAGVMVGGGVGIGMGVGLPLGLEVLGSVLFATLAPVGTVVLGYISARAIYRQLVGNRRRAMDALFDRVVQEAEASIAAGGERSSDPGDRTVGKPGVKGLPDPRTSSDT